ncbi:MAG: hypothetical protein HC819_00380 [Cyclobacteriaceae bacterium]|nr:hypothetical protein [Cyclobacteriaceae bacterium]
MKKISIIFALLLVGICAQQTQAQYSGDYEYSSEMLWGITKATNSGLIGGFIFKYNKELKEDHFHGGVLEIVNIKHPQEQRYYRENSFILGKQHYLYSIRLSYSREYTIFKKASQQGVQVNGILSAGPTIGLEAPYYVEVGYGNFSRNEPYDPNKSQNILGSGYVLQGLGESSIVPGLNLKAGVSFEFGSFKSNVVGLEVGFQSDIFTRKIIIMPATENYSIFPSAYVTLFYGSRR